MHHCFRHPGKTWLPACNVRPAAREQGNRGDGTQTCQVQLEGGMRRVNPLLQVQAFHERAGHAQQQPANQRGGGQHDHTGFQGVRIHPHQVGGGDQ